MAYGLIKCELCNHDIASSAHECKNCGHRMDHNAGKFYNSVNWDLSFKIFFVNLLMALLIFFIYKLIQVL